MELAQYRELTFPLMAAGDVAQANQIHPAQLVYVGGGAEGYAFIDELEAEFPGFTHNQHGYVVPWANKSVASGVQSMVLVQEALAGRGLVAVPYYGTLLGMTRDNSLIAWDDDIDMMVLNREPEPMPATVSWVNNELLDLVMEALPGAGRYHTGKKRQFTHIPVSHRHDGQTNKVDIFLPVLAKEVTTVWIPGDRHRPITFDFVGAVETSFMGHNLTVPAATAEVLTFLYGDDWSTPIKCHRFRTGFVVGPAPEEQG